jgi:hypothetical protein
MISPKSLIDNRVSQDIRSTDEIPIAYRYARSTFQSQKKPSRQTRQTCKGQHVRHKRNKFKFLFIINQRSRGQTSLETRRVTHSFTLLIKTLSPHQHQTINSSFHHFLSSSFHHFLSNHINDSSNDLFRSTFDGQSLVQRRCIHRE